MPNVVDPLIDAYKLVSVLGKPLGAEGSVHPSGQRSDPENRPGAASAQVR